jgi:hypothetical protein
MSIANPEAPALTMKQRVFIGVLAKLSFANIYRRPYTKDWFGHDRNSKVRVIEEIVALAESFRQDFRT